MERVLEMGKASAAGSYQLLTGVANSTIIMAIGTIIFGRLMTTDEYGLYEIDRSLDSQRNEGILCHISSRTFFHNSFIRNSSTYKVLLNFIL